MTLLASIRPDSWNVPLFVHVFGAMILMGGLLTAALSLGLARGRESMLRMGYFSLLAVGLPGYIVMRVGAEWLYSKEGLDNLEDDPAWIGIGYVTADAGALLLLIALITGGIGVRKLRNGGGSGLLRTSMILSVILLLAYVIAIWAMSGKPD